MTCIVGLIHEGSVQMVCYKRPQRERLREELG